MSPGERDAVVQGLLDVIGDAGDQLDDDTPECVFRAVIAAALSQAYDAGASRLAEVEAENERLRGVLRAHGEHRWKCAISRYLRDRDAKRVTFTVTPVCDCGWAEHLRSVADREAKP